MKPFIRRPLALLLCCLCLSLNLRADRFYQDDDAYFLQWLNSRPSGVDSGAAAVVLYEKGITELTNIRGEGMYVNREVHRVIRVLNRSGMEQADVAVTARSSRYRDGEVTGIRCTTYNLEGGQLVRRKMEGASVQKSRTKGLFQAKFSAPGVREGSIIEYRYTIREPFSSLLLASWTFQDELPRRYSELEVFAPEALNMSILTQGGASFPEFDDSRRQLTDDQVPESYRYFETLSGSGMCRKRWVRRNVPAIYEEPFMADLENYTDKVEVKITGNQDFFSASHILDSWEKLNEYLLDHRDFYGQLTHSGSRIKEQATSLTAGMTDHLDRAKAIYRFVRSQFTANGRDEILVSKDLDKVLQERAGSASEINLLLIALLRSAGMTCQPVILSTRDQARPMALFPVLDRFNYTVAALKLDGATYYLDAADRHVPFGVLSPLCYNGYSWLVDRKGSEVQLLPEQLHERALVSVTTTQANPEDYRLEFKEYFGPLSGRMHRTEWQKDTTAIRKHILEALKGLTQETALLSYEIKHLDDPDSNLLLRYQVAVKWPADAATIYLSPVLIRPVGQNPFKAEQRVYPVEMPGASDYTYSLNLKLPEGYRLDEGPKPVTYQIDAEDEYRYLIDYNPETRVLQLNARMRMRRASFATEEYEALRLFFEGMIERQQQTCILKKS